MNSFTLFAKSPPTLSNNLSLLRHHNETSKVLGSLLVLKGLTHVEEIPVRVS